MKRFTYDEILARGALRWVSDAKLREQIANYYVGTETTAVTFDNVPPYRELLRANMPNEAQQAVRRDCPERIQFAPDGAGRAALSGNCATLTLDPASTSRAAAEVRAIPGLRKALTRLVSDLDVKVSLAEAIADHARDVRKLVADADAR